jgi:hypothetical protein
MKTAIVAIEIPYGQPEPMKQWNALYEKLSSSVYKTEGLIEASKSLWIIPLPSGLSFLSLCVLATQAHKLSMRVAFLEEEIQWTTIPPMA